VIQALAPRYPLWSSVGLGASAGQTALTLGTPLASGGAILGGAAASAAGITSASLITAGVTAGIGLIAAAVALWLGRAGPKQNVATTSIVNEAEPLLKQNLAAWQASPKGCADQATALANALQVWYAVAHSCAQPSLGDPGHSCLDDRLPQGVTFNYNTFNIVGNGMWDWFAWYVMPILNDPAAQSCCPPQIYYDPNGTAPVPMPPCVQSTSAGNLLSQLTGVGSSSFDWTTLLIPAALILLIWWFA